MVQSPVYGARRVDGILGMGGSGLVYTLFAAYLCRPYWSDWQFDQRLLPVALCLGAVGAYLLSRRWVRSTTASLWCGMLYGFGPLTLYLTRFHFTTEFIVAAVPWLFCPWAYTRRWIAKPMYSLPGQWLSGLLLVLPFLLITGMFKLLASRHLFVIPIQIGPLHASEWTGLFVPLVMAKHNSITWGFYHVSLGALLIGVVMVIKARRWSLLAGLLLSFMVAVWHPVSEVSPLIWLTIPVLLMTVCVAIGLQGLLFAGTPDRTWVIVAALLLGVLSVVMLLQAGKYFQLWLGLPYGRLFVMTGKLYILGAVGLMAVYGLIRMRVSVRWRPGPWVRLCCIGVTLAIDIVISAVMMFDQIF